MMRLLLACAMLLLAACASPGTDTAGPETAMPPPSAIPSAVASVTPVLRPTLPPEWTRPPQPSATPVLPTAAPTATIDERGTSLFALPTEAFCAGFQVDTVRSTEEFLPRQDVRLAWYAVPGADAYKVTLTDINRVVLYETVTIDLEITVPGSYIGEEAFYLYSIRPLNPGAVQICNAAGQLLRLRTD
jgi:hypothetical protein